MKTHVLQIDSARPEPANLAQAARLIDDGNLVAIPTETVYGIAARAEKETLEKLSQLKNRQPDKFYTVHIGSKTKVHDYVPHIGLLGEKLIDRFWPGPLTIVFTLNKDDLRIQREKLDESLFSILYPTNTIGIRCVSDPIGAGILDICSCPVVVPSANVSGLPPATDAKTVLKAFDGQIPMIVDGGPCEYRKNSTVITIEKGSVSILREGVLSNQAIKDASTIQILIVCTGNTCRSPMAEGMFKKELSENFGCGIDELPEKGYKIISAGTMGASGWPASEEAINACADMQIDIRRHRNQPLTNTLIRQSDLIFAMSRAHWQAVVGLCPEKTDRCMLLGDDEIPDPIGQNRRVYRKCADVIYQAVRKKWKEVIL